MRIVIAGDYPEDPPNLVGGIQAVIYHTLLHLGRYDDLDLHMVTCEKWRRQQTKPEVVQHGPWTVHYLPSSPRLPHTLTMLTLDRRAVRRRIERLAPDLVHAHGQAAAYPFAAFDSRRPTLVTVHGINMLEAQVDRRGSALKGGLRVALWGYAERRCLRLATDIAVISPFVRDVIAPHTRARLHDVENPVHDDLFDLEPAPQPGKVLMVGSIQKRKGTLEAMQAMALVRERVPGAQLYLAGGFMPSYAAYGQEVRRWVAENNAGAYIHFLGNLDHAALLEAYRTAQVFLLPSYLEASSVAVAEAMAAGLPSVVSDIGGTAHLVEQGLTGYRVPAGDVQSLARRVIALLLDEALCRRMGQRARAFAREHCSGRVAAQKTYDLYRSLGSGRL
ncbi:MAG: glycosyltransferase family 4 protein [Anaerolineae bacterium]